MAGILKVLFPSPGIKAGNMAPYYKEICEEFGWPLDEKFYAEMKEANDKRLKELDLEHEKNMMDEEDQVRKLGK